MSAKKDTTVEAGNQRDEPHFKIIVAKVEKTARNSINPVPVGVNGIMYTVPRGQVEIVPACVVENLRNAVEQTYEGGESNNRDANYVPSYPFQIIEGPFPASVATKMRADLLAARSEKGNS